MYNKLNQSSSFEDFEVEFKFGLRANFVDFMYGRSSSSSHINSRTPNSYSNPSMNDQTSYYERQNDEHIDLLTNKVSQLKSVSDKYDPA